MTNEVDVQNMKQLCQKLRCDLIELLFSKQTGHPGGSLSAVEILATLYFSKMNIDAKNPQKTDRDRFVLGKGHAAPILYLILAELGFFPGEELKTFRQLGSILQGHPTKKTPGVEAATGPLGMGLSVAAGMAAALKMEGLPSKVYCLIGDGELQEGIIWETAMSASKFKQDNLICILDHNGVQLDGMVKDIMPLNSVSDIFRDFGWEVFSVDGHNLKDLLKIWEQASSCKGKPIFIDAQTVKGKGVSFMENDHSWHGKAIDQECYKKAMSELGR